jgi:hypothetical protein
VARQVLQVVLVLAISTSAIVVLASLREPVVSMAHEPATGVSDIDARWIPKWYAAADMVTADQGFLVDTRSTAKWARADAEAKRAVP